MSRRRSERTLDFFTDWQPPVVPCSEVDIRPSSFRGRLGRAISTMLKECQIERFERIKRSARSQWKDGR